MTGGTGGKSTESNRAPPRIHVCLTNTRTSQQNNPSTRQPTPINQFMHPSTTVAISIARKRVREANAHKRWRSLKVCVHTYTLVVRIVHIIVGIIFVCIQYGRIPASCRSTTRTKKWFVRHTSQPLNSPRIG